MIGINSTHREVRRPEMTYTRTFPQSNTHQSRRDSAAPTRPPWAPINTPTPHFPLISSSLRVDCRLNINASAQRERQRTPTRLSIIRQHPTAHTRCSAGITGWQKEGKMRNYPGPESKLSLTVGMACHQLFETATWYQGNKEWGEIKPAHDVVKQEEN